jgi:hypothetical protein
MKKIELYLTAHAAALASAAVEGEADVELAYHAAFTDAKHDKADFGEWKRMFLDRRCEIVSLTNTPTDSQLAADKKAAALAATATAETKGN